MVVNVEKVGSRVPRVAGMGLARVIRGVAMGGQMQRWSMIGLCYLLSGLVFAGCSHSMASNRPRTVPVNGVVNFKGAPVAGATVTFMAIGRGGRGATAITNSSGHFELTTFEPRDGAIPGNYRVKIAKTVTVEMPSAEKVDPYKAMGMPPLPHVEKDLLPKKYKQDTTSGLTAEVRASGENVFKFDLAE